MAGRRKGSKPRPKSETQGIHGRQPPTPRKTPVGEGQANFAGYRRNTPSPSKLDGLTDKQQKFVNLILEGETAGNAFMAAYDGTYKKTTAGPLASQLMRHPGIIAALQRRGKLIAKKVDLSVENTLEEVRRIAHAVPLAEYQNEDGTFKDAKEWTAEMDSAIDSIEVRELWNEDGTKQGEIKKIRRNSKIEALKLQGKYLNLFVDRVKIEGKVEVEHKASLCVEELLTFMTVEGKRRALEFLRQKQEQLALPNMTQVVDAVPVQSDNDTVVSEPATLEGTTNESLGDSQSGEGIDTGA